MTVREDWLQLQMYYTVLLMRGITQIKIFVIEPFNSFIIDIFAKVSSFQVGMVY